MLYYNFEETTFSNYVWVKQGSLFYNPYAIDIEKWSDHQIAVEVYDSDGTYYGKDVVEGYGWNSVYFYQWYSLPENRSYKIRLVNENSGTAEIFQGSLMYNY